MPRERSHIKCVNLQYSIIVLMLINRIAFSMIAEDYIAPITEGVDIESYHYSDRIFILHNKPLKWKYARHACRGLRGKLAVANTAAIADFLAEALSESAMALEDVWVGAARDPRSAEGYRWIESEDAYLPREKFWNVKELDTRSTRYYPQWISRGLNHTPGHCVTIERTQHNIPVFVDLDCDTCRPFFCEKKIDNENMTPRFLASVMCKDHQYKIYVGRKTWEEAAGFCSIQGMRLATIYSSACLDMLSKRMLRSRPSLENAWIGARGQSNVWTWDSTDENIDNVKKTENETMWPPFRPGYPRKSEGCLLLDRHISDRSIFLEARCDRKRDFICESEELSKTPSVPAPVEYKGHILLLISNAVTWYAAQLYCKASGGWLINIDTEDIFLKVLNIMAEEWKEGIRHLWLGGKLNASARADRPRWYQDGNGAYIPGPLDAGVDINGGSFYLPWCDDSLSLEYGCLNLDRENHLMGIVYGMPCITKQQALCQIPKQNWNGPTASVLKDPTNGAPEAGVPMAENKPPQPIHSVEPDPVLPAGKYFNGE